MSEKHKIGSDGMLDDGVRTDPLTPQDFMLYGQAQHALSQWTAPVLLHAENPHERLIVINVDGTGNDMVNDPEHITNIGLFNEALDDLASSNHHIHAIYEVGPGTQKNIVARMADGALGYTYDAHLEHAYKQLIDQAYTWHQEDPQADIRIAITGFSRGGDEAAGLARLIHERGIQDPSGMVVKHHLLGHDTVTYTQPPLVPPGQTMQAVMLLDPVGTGVPYRRDRQLPPSVVSGLQITARDERRDAFASSEIIPNGLSADGRFLQITVPGAHSDIGGSYHRNGVSTLNFNIAADYLNALSDTPLLREKALPQDPAMYAIHHSEDHQWFYTTKYETQHGERGLRGAQQSAPDCRATIACLPPEPLDPSLATALQARHPITVSLAPSSPSQTAPTMQPVTSVKSNAGLVGNAEQDALDHLSLSAFSQPQITAAVDQQERLSVERQQRIQPQPQQPVLRLDDPTHPDHTLFLQAREGVRKLDQQHGHTNQVRSDQLAAALTAEARRHQYHGITQVYLSPDRQRVQAYDHSSVFSPMSIISVNTVEALNTPIEHSSHQWQQTKQSQVDEQAHQRAQMQTHNQGMSR